MAPNDKPWRDRDTLYELYVKQELTTYEIGEKLGCSDVTISNWLKKNGIETRDRTQKQGPWTSKSTLRELYIEKELSMAEIADKLGTGSWTIRYWLNNHGIEVRDRHEKMVEAARTGPVQLVVDQDGYERWDGAVDGVRWSFGVHRLVAIAEYGVDQVKDKIVHHKNEIPWDNRPENLEPMTRSDHIDHHVNDTNGGGER